MRFTTYQYDRAIEALQFAKQQLEPDGNCCAVCGDSGHMAFECGCNPLVAVAICRDMAKGAEGLHETLHLIAGYDQHMGVQLGPARCSLPFRSEEETRAALSGDWDKLRELENKAIAGQGEAGKEGRGRCSGFFARSRAVIFSRNQTIRRD